MVKQANTPVLDQGLPPKIYHKLLIKTKTFPASWKGINSRGSENKKAK